MLVPVCSGIHFVRNSFQLSFDGFWAVTCCHLGYAPFTRREQRNLSSSLCFNRSGTNACPATQPRGADPVGRLSVRRPQAEAAVPQPAGKAAASAGLHLSAGRDPVPSEGLRRLRAACPYLLRQQATLHSAMVLLPDHQQNCGIHNGLRHGRHEPADIEQPSLLLQQLE
ncbi:hypothetical protein AVEN_197550-1 [Araneus ventricosus]|uniref:Uncharacterized protein n=1 Tax=Araneus ventricosus TaxID=182803 RepID=A0A4Y2BUA8_ARAVE|nr:hypothetical protein AVEN_197550-1 [Araneus ventricosus]